MRTVLSFVVLIVATPAAAEVKQADDAGFESVHDVTVAKDAAAVWEALRAPARWWNKDHTYTGDSANLWLDAQAGGCFCEKLPEKGSIEHLNVVYAQPGKQLRLVGGLGPLQSEPAMGVMTWTLKPGKDGLVIGMSYVVHGRVRMEGGMKALAPVVDRVLGEQMAGLKAHLDQP